MSHPCLCYNKKIQIGLKFELKVVCAIVILEYICDFVTLEFVCDFITLESMCDSITLWVNSWVLTKLKFIDPSLEFKLSLL
jgi:hypothetical protein